MNEKCKGVIYWVQRYETENGQWDLAIWRSLMTFLRLVLVKWSVFEESER